MSADLIVMICELMINRWDCVVWMVAGGWMGGRPRPGGAIHVMA
jgi:hypothetical protein